MGNQRKQTIDIFVEGKKKRLRGVTKYTTCDDIIKMVIQKTAFGTADATSFAVFESRDGVERILSRKVNVLKLLRSWGSDASKSDIVVRRLGDVKSKMAKNYDKNKRLSRLRSRLFSAVQDKNGAFIDNDNRNCLFDTTNYSNSSQRLVADDNHSRLYKQKNSRFVSKHASGAKLSVFRKIFYSMLRKNQSPAQDTGKKVKTQKCTKIHKYNYVNRGATAESDLDLNINPFTTHHIDSLDESNALDKAFIDDSECLDLEMTNNSLLNMCSIQDLTDHTEEMNESVEACASIRELEENIEVDENNTLAVEQSFVKLNQIKKMFELNDSHCRSEDDFMESFMRTKLYESESDEDM